MKVRISFRHTNQAIRAEQAVNKRQNMITVNQCTDPEGLNSRICILSSKGKIGRIRINDEIVGNRIHNKRRISRIHVTKMDNTVRSMRKGNL